jgi:predicted nucleic acid-binding protein
VIAVINASPLIYLGKLGLLPLMQHMFETVITVQTVKDEVLDPDTPEYSALATAFADWLLVSEVKSSSLVDRLREMGLHDGEVMCLALAHEERKNHAGAVIVIDDLAARDVARALGLRVTGTVGMIMRAKKSGMIDREAALAHVRRLVENTSFRMSTSLYSRIISELEEGM